MSEEVTRPLKKKRSKEEILEIIVAIFLGITALATAWGSWVGSLHGGNQATNYTTSNNLAADGNARYNQAAQTMMQDMILWSEIGDLQMDIQFSQTYEDEITVQMDSYKLYYKCMEQLSETMAEQIAWDFDTYMDMEPEAAVLAWMTNEQALTSPFSSQEYVDAYFADANEVLAQSEEVLAQGKQDNANGDAFGLATVIYSVVLFMLGIAGTFKNLPNRTLIVAVAILGFVAATVYMMTIPMPTGFHIASFFGG